LVLPPAKPNLWVWIHERWRLSKLKMQPRKSEYSPASGRTDGRGLRVDG
jgi:hypothetical protein